MEFRKMVTMTPSAFISFRWCSDKESVADAGVLGSIPRLGRLPGEGYASPAQYSCLENLTDRGGYWATVMGLKKSQTQLSTRTHTHCEQRNMYHYGLCSIFSPTIHTTV